VPSLARRQPSLPHHSVPSSRDARRGVVVPEDLERVLGDAADGHVREEREEVARPAARVLADAAGRVRAGGVEVPERERAPARGLGRADVREQRLAHDLAAPVRAVRLQARALRDRDLRRRAVHGRGARVDHARAAPAGHRLAERDGRRDVVLVVEERELDGLADGFVRLRADVRSGKGGAAGRKRARTAMCTTPQIPPSP
jgi:hypothetical protein